METLAAQFNANGLILGDVTREHRDVQAVYVVDLQASDDDQLVADVQLHGPRHVLAWTLIRLWWRYRAKSINRRWGRGTFQARTTFRNVKAVANHPFYRVVSKHRNAARRAEFHFGSGLCTVQFAFDAGAVPTQILLDDLRDAVAAARLTAVVREVAPRPMVAAD